MQLGLARVQQTGTLFWGVPSIRSRHPAKRSLRANELNLRRDGVLQRLNYMSGFAA